MTMHPIMSTGASARGLSSIKAILMIAFGCLTFLVTAALVWKGVSSWTSYRIAVDQKEFDTAANHFIAGLYEVLLERLATNNALQAIEPASSSVLAAIEAHRKIVSENFDVGLATLETRDFPNKQALMQDLRAALQKANEHRRQVDEAIKRSRGQRDENLRKNFAPVVTDSVNAALKVWFSALYNTAKNDPQLARLASIKEIGWRMRDYSGQERANVATAIVSGAAIPADRLAANAEMRSRVAMLWQQLQNLTLDADTHPVIKDAMRSAQEKYFKQFLSLSDDMRKVGEAGGKYPMTAAQWVETTNPQIGGLLSVLYAAGTASEAATAMAIDRSFRETAITFGLMLLGFAIAAGCMWAVTSRVSKPLTAMTGVMGALAQGRNDVEVPGTERADEIGQMARAVLVFRDAGLEKVRLEAQAAEQRREAEEERRRNAEAQAKTAEEQARVVQNLAQGLKSLSEGDLTFRLTDGFTETYLQIRDDFNTAMTQLQETITAIAISAREVAGASGEISGGSTDLSQRTEEQAASLEETSASMEEISATVKKNAENAQQANQFAVGTREVADRGGAVVAQAVSAMARIEESSRKISDIISVIDEIARQTNLLALNAAVEAARAGEAGRGFAVVASEVRSLAQRSSQAAKDIKDLITNSSVQVQEGVDLVNRTGASLNEIVASIKKVAEIVSDIASASAEQSSGINQVNAALTQMDEVTQQNSALVEQNAASAKSLEQQSHAMDERVSFFRLDDAQAASDEQPAPTLAFQRSRRAAG